MFSVEKEIARSINKEEQKKLRKIKLKNVGETYVELKHEH